MPREIIHLQVGQCGNQCGLAVWEELLQEHRIATDGKYTKREKEECKEGDDFREMCDELSQIDVYFTPNNESVDKAMFVPRAVVVDLEPGVVDTIKASNYGEVFKPDSMICGANGAGNNWAKGHYTEGAELVEEVLDVVRKEVENCNCPQGFQFFHSLGGGTGSGMGTLLILKIRDNYPDRITTSYSVYPSPLVSDTVVEPYNACLSSHQLLENCDETFIIDNESLYNIFHNKLKIKEPNYKQLNTIISSVACGITSSLRFPGMLNSDLRKLGTNLVPFPRLHFFLVAQAPLQCKKEKKHLSLNIKELTSQAFDESNFFSNIRNKDGKTLACSLTFRGEDLSSQVIDDEIRKKQVKDADHFVEWIPSNVKSGIVRVPPISSAVSCTAVTNTTALKVVYQRIITQFGAMYKRKAFLHWYKNEGMDEMEFEEAEKNIRDLITEYQDKQEAVIEECDDDEDEDDDDI